ncbi:MAG TPA: hypothetical protein VEH81_13580 [Ktedonobacteraceae bacterium]|nr:hypothetical protein [Ktedonobacteraceae bacterium]
MLILAFLLLVLFIGFDLAALRWGVDSSDGVNNPEWQRRQRWYGFH